MYIYNIYYFKIVYWMGFVVRYTYNGLHTLKAQCMQNHIQCTSTPPCYALSLYLSVSSSLFYSLWPSVCLSLNV